MASVTWARTIAPGRAQTFVGRVEAHDAVDLGRLAMRAADRPVGGDRVDQHLDLRAEQRVAARRA